jgi:hypothetical protein
MPCCLVQIAYYPRSVRARIEELAEHTAAEEIMVTTNVCDTPRVCAPTNSSPGSSSSSGRRPSPCSARKE